MLNSDEEDEDEEKEEEEDKDKDEEDAEGAEDQQGDKASKDEKGDKKKKKEKKKNKDKKPRNEDYGNIHLKTSCESNNKDSFIRIVKRQRCRELSIRTGESKTEPKNETVSAVIWFPDS